MDWFEYENQLKQKGFPCVCGIDEAGRGPLAGPVFAAAVILPPDCMIDGLNDSKKLTEKKREALFPVIQQKAIAWSVASADEKEIDDMNILQATFLAMRRALAGLEISADAALVDGNLDPGLGITALPVVKGDAKSASIAAASILAKVSRDRFMYSLDEKYPEYAFAQHKGYGTRLHYERLAEFGISPVHRRSFLKKWVAENAGRG